MARPTVLVPPARSGTGPVFTPQTLAFLRALKRNNRREWFHANKARYEEVVRAPMIALVERLAHEFASFAPDLVATPRASMYRINRDTRFSADKSPYKTNVSAVFPHRALSKHGGAGLYLEVATQHVWIGGGMYMPEPSHLHLVREHIASNYRQFRSIVESPAFRRQFGHIEGAQLQRVPLGFPKDHPAAEWLKYKQFLAIREEPAAFATSPGYYAAVVSAFKTLAPLIAFLNAPLVAVETRPTEPSKWLSRDR